MPWAQHTAGANDHNNRPRREAGFQRRLDDKIISSLNRAVALDEKAWILAIHGFNSEEAAKTAREALAVLGALKYVFDKEKAKRFSYARDALAYILMKTDHLEEALELKEADRYTLNTAGGFRHALLLHMLGRELEAVRKLKQSMGNGVYSPGHELYLLNQYFWGSSPFVKTL
jgi:hypothetical protein